MTPAQVAHIMALVKKWHDDVLSPWEDQSWEAIEAALRDAPQQAIPAGTRVVDRGFRFEGEKQEHIPQLVIEFEPVPVNSEYGAKGWKDRDYVAAMLTTCDCPAKDMPFGRCCKVTPSAPTAVEPDERARFHAWANQEGCDVACTYDTERSRWIYFNPMTADLWKAWRASKGTP